MNPVDAKRTLRTAAIARRAHLVAASPDAGRSVAANLPSALLADRGIAAGYWPMRDELDVRPSMLRLTAAGWRLALPVVVGRERPLAFRAWTPGDALRPAAFGQSEPDTDRPAVVPDLLLVPLLAFDSDGWRLGYGGGFYDRTLAALRGQGTPVAVGVAFAGQAVAAVPHGPLDQRLDWVVTEDGAFAIR